MNKILIIEDDNDIAEVERDYLLINGFEADITDNGITGIDKIKQGNYDLVLLDLMLSGLDGFTVCKRLREITDILILMVTARKEDIDKIRGLGLNADIMFDKETIYEKIWGFDSLGDTATVAVHINRLREKLEDEPSKPKHIQTVWGAGYRFKG